MTPTATYRIQLNRDFNFCELKKIIPYLHELGVSTLYASPIFTATTGSDHGYDVTDANEINPEIGDYEQLKEISALLDEYGMTWLQDIVPNHMAYNTQNKWLMDVLEHGPGSPYARYFDIDWSHPLCPGKIMLPILSEPLEQEIASGNISVTREKKMMLVSYNGTSYPLTPGSYEMAGRKDLLKLLDAQHYRMCEWRETDKHINYRRFFTINGMICLNIQDDKVFADHHRLIKKLLSKNIVHGLRVDHIDGLYDPTKYLQRLRELGGDTSYIIVEKILQPEEALPSYWPIQGTTGYDLIGLINGLFSERRNTELLTSFYRELTGKGSYRKELEARKENILYGYMGGELDNLCNLFQNTNTTYDPPDRDKVKKVIALLLIHFPVYRYYSATFPIDEAELKGLNTTFDKLRKEYTELTQEVEMLETFIKSKPGIDLFKRCMQFAGPLMAKGVEDTLMYTYNCFLGHNEVGDSPSEIGLPVAEFHNAIRNRQKKWPHTMNATATHDTKRGEDARARLLAITTMANTWQDRVRMWQQMNANFKTNGAPVNNDEYFIYQSLAAFSPRPGTALDDFKARFEDYMKKALREAKTHSTWEQPNEEYESAVIQFVKRITAHESPFQSDFTEWHKTLTDAGIIISLSQLALKCTCPGIPDIYQGCELWDLSMVDPDNRRAVNYESRRWWLQELKSYDETDLSRLWNERYSGKIKLWLLQKLLQIRNNAKEVFEGGEYLPLETTGPRKNDVIAYARVNENECYIIIAALSGIAENGEKTNWHDTEVVLPRDVDSRLSNKLTGELISTAGTIPIAQVFDILPVSILHSTMKKNNRAAGILLPIFSLPSPYGIGDFGKEAMNFADFLARSNQRYWQILPLNPINAGSLYSPYSSNSAMACNPLFISPEGLVEDGLIEEQALHQYSIEGNDKADYGYAEATKRKLIDDAYQKYSTHSFSDIRHAFETFCKKQNKWLQDYALFVALKSTYQDGPWHHWPEEYKNRDKKAIAAFAKEHREFITKVKWEQFITNRQWLRLRDHCNDRAVKLFGDLPFYVNHDSADVWAYPQIFNLDDNGDINGVAGVPPDYFSEDGQLWGVPTFKWNVLKDEKYDWWVNRMKRNMELFDLVRIDHFRALETYWEVKAGETTAKKGQWKKGPGMDFFKTLRKKLGDLPFVAEDLGYEMDDVYILREECGLPGMKVLQFAWGDNIGINVDSPHNYPHNCIVYTGTHDNNTTKGWYKLETSDADRQRMHEYTGWHIDEHNVQQLMTRLAYASAGNLVIIPMQDVLALDEHARINTPGTIAGNWNWRLSAGTLTSDVEHHLRQLTTLYNRK